MVLTKNQEVLLWFNIFVSTTLMQVFNTHLRGEDADGLRKLITTIIDIMLSLHKFYRPFASLYREQMNFKLAISFLSSILVLIDAHMTNRVTDKLCKEQFLRISIEFIQV